MLGYTPIPEYTGYGQQAGGTHPTGMHTCMHTCSHCNEKGNNSDFFWGGCTHCYRFWSQSLCRYQCEYTISVEIPFTPAAIKVPI